MGCCSHYHCGPWRQEDAREYEYELLRRRRERPDRGSDAIRDLEARQRELEAELAELREKIHAQAP